MEDTPRIQLVDVSKRFDSKTVLDGASLTIRKGQVTSVIGKSGVGKSVLLKLIAGLQEPDGGRILFDGRPLSEMKSRERRDLKRRFSFMFQGNALFDSLTVYDNVALPLRERGRMKEEEIREKIREKMEQLDLQESGRKYPSQLSGGMQKRVALARALVTDPEIVLFDEPTTGLDPIRKNAVHGMIAEYQKKFGFTGVVVSHEIPDIFYISQRVAMLDEGRILFEGSPEEIQKSENPVVEEFIHVLDKTAEDFRNIDTQREGERRYQQELARYERYGSLFSIILFTVENLEEINDTVGQMAGPTVLKNFADRVQQQIRVTDICSRYGLNRILLILPNTGGDQARHLCDKLARRMQEENFLPIETPEGFCYAISAGVVEAERGQPLGTLIGEAGKRQNTFYNFEVCEVSGG